MSGKPMIGEHDKAADEKANRTYFGVKDDTGGASATWGPTTNKQVSDVMEPKVLIQGNRITHQEFKKQLDMDPGDNILYAADEITNGARRKAYGHPENNFGRIADLWNAYRQNMNHEEFTPQDIAQMMILMKIARLQESPDHRDSLIDLAGYARTIEMLWETD
jgi:hypothetical protein